MLTPVEVKGLADELVAWLRFSRTITCTVPCGGWAWTSSLFHLLETVRWRARSFLMSSFVFFPSSGCASSVGFEEELVLTG